MPDWREAAHAEVAALKPYYVAKHGWQPEVSESDDAVDLFVHFRGCRFRDREYLLRLRYLADWQSAGRREAFVDPGDREHADSAFWPPEGNGLNPNYRREPSSPVIPCICLRGVWGFHSLLHTEQPMDESATLQRFLVELQKVMDG